jgi:molybdopterin converting factor small subunit
MIQVLIASPIRSCTEGASTVSVEANSIREAMDRLVHDFPRLRQQLYDDSGTLRSFVSLFLNGEDIHLHEGLMSRVSTGDTLEILLAISGGSQGAEKQE